MGSDNPTGADNQQETSTRRLELDPLWVAGFVDGEGCFCVSVHRNPVNARRTGGWQLHPVFQVYQHQRHRAVLEELITFFGCGRLRPKGPRSSVITYAVDSMRSLEGSILPFFERHPSRGEAGRLLVVRRDRQIDATEGASPATRVRTACPAGLRHERRRQAAKPNRRRDPGILRDCTPGPSFGRPNGGEDTVRSAWRHAESGRNDLTPCPATSRE